jgi:DNA repair protein RecO (recombination protein O)
MTQILKTPALLLKRLNYSESDRIVVLYTRLAGKVSALARSARKSQKRFGACLEPFVLFEAEIGMDPDRELGSLRQAHSLTTYRGLLKDLGRLGLGYRILELMDGLEPDAHPAPDLFDRLENTLRVLQVHPHPLKALVLFEADLLRTAGLAPVLDRCCQCGRIPPFPRPAFSLSQGGLVCPACAPRAKGTGLDLELAVLQGLFEGMEPGHSEKEAARFLESVLQYHLGRRLKTEYLAEV